jgi:hypothetical protein
MFCKTLKLLILILIISLISSCIKNGYEVRSQEPAVINQAESEVVIKSVEFVFSSQKTNGKQFAKIEKWDVAKIANNQNSFDIVCEIENKGNSSSDFVVLTSGDFIVAPRNKYSEADLGKLVEEVSWGRVTSMNDLKAKVVKHLKPGETRKIIFENFNIGDVIKDFSSGYDSLWAWLFRINVRVENRDGEKIVERQAILPIIPKRVKTN